MNFHWNENEKVMVHWCWNEMYVSWKRSSFTFTFEELQEKMAIARRAMCLDADRPVTMRFWVDDSDHCDPDIEFAITTTLTDEEMQRDKIWNDAVKEQRERAEFEKLKLKFST